MRFRFRHTIRAASIAILGLNLASCEGPAGPPPPAFSLSATALVFSDDNNQRMIAISNLGNDPIDWRVLSSTASWLMASPSGGALGPGASGTLAVQIDRVAVSRGTHSAALQIGASGQSALINVSVQEAEASPAVASLQPSAITIGPLDASKVIEVVNAGGSSLTWTLSGPSWATLTPRSGNLAGGDRTQILVTPDRTGLTNGQYIGTLQLSSNGGSRTANLELSVNGVAGLGLSPGSLNFGTTATELPMRVENHGDQSIQWSAHPGKPWLSASPASGTVPPGLSQLISVNVSRSGMPPGRNETTLAFSSNRGSTVATVVAEVASPGGPPNPPPPDGSLLTVSPVSLNFAQSATELSLSLHNDGDEPLDWTAQVDASWISLPTSTGRLSPHSSAPVAVRVSRTGLTAGTYVSTLRFTYDGGVAVATISATVAGLPPDSTTPPPDPDPDPDPTGALLNLIPTSLDFGTTVTDLTILVRSLGTSTLTWTAQPSHGWLSVSASSGHLDPGAVQAIQVTAARSSLKTPGLYESSIQFSSNGGNGSVPVMLSVVPSGPPPPPPPPGSLDDIDATGKTDVTAQLNAYLESVPDGSVIRFPDGALYRVEGVLQLVDRNNLTIEGNGATVFADTDGSGVTPPEKMGHLWPRQRSHVAISGGSNIVIRDLIVRGANPNAGSAEGAYVASLEGQHGIDVHGVNGLTLENVTVTDTYGDFLYLSPDYSTSTWAKNIVVRNSHFERSGRQGVAIVGAEDVLIETSYIGEVGRTMLDIEPLGPAWGAHRITFQNNTFGPCRHLLLSSGGGGPNVQDIALIGNQLVGMGLKIKAIPSDGSRRSGYRIIDNTSDVPVGLPVPALKFYWADGIEVRGNHQLMAVLRDMTGVYACESTGVSVNGNDFPGALRELAVESVCPVEASE